MLFESHLKVVKQKNNKSQESSGVEANKNTLKSMFRLLIKTTAKGNDKGSKRQC